MSNGADNQTTLTAPQRLAVAHELEPFDCGAPSLDGNRSDPPPQPSPTRGEGVIAKQLLSVFPLPLWEGVRGRGVNAYA